VINGIDTGLYVNAEQRDKRFLENRGLWVGDETWLYEVEDLQGFELDEGGPGDSPTFQALCYSPFAAPATCSTPPAATLAAQLPALVDMKGLLAMAAVDAFAANPDAVFSHGKNFFFADWLSGTPPRLHFPWDLDAALGGGSVNADVYAPQSAYSEILLGVPEFRTQYSQILNQLVCGPFAESQLHEFIDALEPVISAALTADPNNQLDGEPVDEFFDARRAWFSQRIASVTAQIEGFVPCDEPLPTPTPACGNSIVNSGEQCDSGTSNGTEGSCCTATCQFKPNGNSSCDGNNCTRSDICTNGVCSPGACADGSAC
jgi:hypothetical protein